MGRGSDIAIVSPGEARTITRQNRRAKAGYAPFEGFRAIGRASATIRRGEIRVCDGAFAAGEPRGKFIPSVRVGLRRSARFRQDT